MPGGREARIATHFDGLDLPGRQEPQLPRRQLSKAQGARSGLAEVVAAMRDEMLDNRRERKDVTYIQNAMRVVHALVGDGDRL